MNIRVTGQTQVANATAYLRRQAAGVAKYQDQVGSGVRVALPSDDPSQFPALSRAKAAAGRYAAYSATVADATAGLNAGVAALGEVNSALVRAKQIAVEGANGTVGGQEYEALAAEVDGLLDRVLTAANAEVDGSNLFGGTGTGGTPFRVSGFDSRGRPAAVAYDGAGDRGQALVGPGQTVPTRYAGDQVFRRGGADVFAALIGLRDDLRSPALDKAAAVGRRLGQVDAAREAVADATAEQASDLAGLQALGNRLADLKLGADARTGEIEGTDYAEAAVQLQQHQTAYEATLAVAARLVQPSLLEFIR